MADHRPIVGIHATVNSIVMKPILIALILFDFFVASYLLYDGFVVVRDETGMVVQVQLTNAHQKQTLVNLPFGYFVGTPRLEGEIEVRCSDGSTVRGGYVTPYSAETVTVTGEGTCEKF